MPEINEADLAMQDFPVRTICGSMRYYAKMLEVARRETANGVIILMPDYTSRKAPDNVKPMLNELHYAKIDMSSSIIVVGMHIGQSTSNEIEYAKSTGKEVLYWTEHFGAIA
jgi:hypothetical protein